MPLNRRQLLAGAAATVATSAIGAGPLAPGRRIAIRGTHLFIDDSGPRDAPALLYLHGGPGAGSLDFQLYQRDRLNRALRVVIIDQRGVLRSDPVTAMRMADLVEDCEALRRTLGIRQWHVLGHSFGGQVALRYALAYPASQRGVIFENPSFSIASSMRSLLPPAADLLAGKGMRARAVAVRHLLAGDPTTRQLWDMFGQVGGELGADRDRLYVHQPALRGFFEHMQAASGLSDAVWSRAGGQVSALTREGRLFDDLTPSLPRMRLRALLLHGAYDLVAAQDQCDAFARSAPGRRVETAPDSAHFIHVEEPDRFARSVIGFVTAT